MKDRLKLLRAVALVTMLCSLPAAAAPANPSAADRALADYFQAETKRLANQCLKDVQRLEDWNDRRGPYRAQLFEMLSLQPLPARGEMHPIVTGRVEREDFVVEKLHFQSMPGLYVTANFYLPRQQAAPLPAILYLSGHGPVISNGVSYGNKVTYQHHGAWFARNGYACLVLDTLQLGEILGLHHGTYREGMWWWNARGYTPAGVEAWNCIRALDYLESRREIDATRIGATGRSGGGAYSWWIAALDDRIKAAAPVAGITDLENHVVDGTVEGHCDCMFTVNTHRWDYPQVAALVAPRPLLIVNTDADSIFPLDGVVRLHSRVRRIYELHRASPKLGLVIGPGPHKDTQDLQVPVFRWFNQHLKGSDPLIGLPAEKLFRPEELKVFARLPTDSINTNIHEHFVPTAVRPPVVNATNEAQAEARLSQLRNTCFTGWPAEAPPLELKKAHVIEAGAMTLEEWDFTSQEHVRLRLILARRPGAQVERVQLSVLGATNGHEEFTVWNPSFVAAANDELALAGVVRLPEPSVVSKLAARLATNNMAMAWFVPRGLGLTAWDPTPRKQLHIRRRFMLLGQTLDGMRVWDVRRAVQAARTLVPQAGVEVRGEGSMACHALYAGLFEKEVRALDLWNLPASHRHGPDYLNVLRVMDVPEAAGLAVLRLPVVVRGNAAAWNYPAAVAKAIGNDRRFMQAEP